MPDPGQVAKSRQIVALALMGSAVMLGGGAMLIYTGVLNVVGEDVRGLLSLVLGVVSVLDFMIGLMFFRMAQSS